MVGKYLQGVDKTKFKATRLLQDGAVRQDEDFEAIRKLQFPDAPFFYITVGD
jgi:hypothetical protein